MLQPFKRYSTSFFATRKETTTRSLMSRRRREKERGSPAVAQTVKEEGGRLARMVVIGFGSTSGSSWRGQPAQSQSPIQPVGCSQSVPEEQLRSRGRALSRLGLHRNRFDCFPRLSAGNLDGAIPWLTFREIQDRPCDSGDPRSGWQRANLTVSARSVSILSAG